MLPAEINVGIAENADILKAQMHCPALLKNLETEMSN